jgi:hypothetical protein
MNTRQMNYTIDSLIRFITVVAFSVLGMCAYFFSIYLKTAIEEGVGTALQDGLLVVVLVSAYWLSASYFSRPRPTPPQTWLKGTRFGIVAILGLIIWLLIRNFASGDAHINSLLSLGFWIYFGEMFLSAELLNLYAAIRQSRIERGK